MVVVLYQKLLKLAGIESEFIGGHRKTSEKALKYIEMALKGEVNGDKPSEQSRAKKAVGSFPERMVNGPPGSVNHRTVQNEWMEEHDLGQVGDVEQVDTTLLDTLLDNGCYQS